RARRGDRRRDRHHRRAARLHDRRGRQHRRARQRGRRRAGHARAAAREQRDLPRDRRVPDEHRGGRTMSTREEPTMTDPEENPTGPAVETSEASAPATASAAVGPDAAPEEEFIPGADDLGAFGEGAAPRKPKNFWPSARRL